MVVVVGLFCFCCEECMELNEFRDIFLFNFLENFLFVKFIMYINNLNKFDIEYILVYYIKVFEVLILLCIGIMY